MKVLHAKCAGLDVHRDSVVACARRQVKRKVDYEVRTFGTTTKDLLALSDWLEELACTHVVMEATGVYWKPVWHVLEDSFELVLANAMHVKNVPGRKTDVNDAMWLSDLLAHGLVRASFVPEGPIQEMRTLTRTRKQLVRERARHIQRIHKTFEDANIKVGAVVSDLDGKSGRGILEALIAGETDPEKLLAATTGRLKADRSVLIEALRGHVTAHHRFLLKLHLDQIKALDVAIDTVDKEVGVTLEPFRDRVDLLVTMPGISDTMAQTIVSEIGYDMSRFPTAAHLISWAGLCPRNDESAGKRRSNRLRKGAPWLKTALVQAAWCAMRKKDSYLRALFFRIQGRRGPKKAAVAVAASMLTAAYYMLRDGVEYRDLGAKHFDRLDKAKTAQRLVRRLRDLGYEVQATAATA
jgi:transposase